MKKNVLFITHKKSKCGVYEYGKNIYNALKESNNFNFIKVECSNFVNLKNAINKYQPIFVIYNYQQSVFPWLTPKIFPKIRKNVVANIPILQIGIIHEVTQNIADTATNYRKNFLVNAALRLNNSIFDFYIAPDTTLLLRNPIVFKTGRLIPFYKNPYPEPIIPTIGSFGFAYHGKGFEKIVQIVNNEFDEAIIRFNIPFGDYVDQNGVNAKSVLNECKSYITKKGIKIDVTHHYFNDDELLDFLAQNTINVFLYEDKSNRGISSTLDFALAVKRPIAISDSIMFRHVLNKTTSICVNNNSLKSIISNGFTIIQELYDDWDEKNLVWEYDRILNLILSKELDKKNIQLSLFRFLQSKWNRFLSKPDISFNWLRSTQQITEDDMTIDQSLQYQPVNNISDFIYNRILNNEARKLYNPTINFLKHVVPKTMSKKIPEANVQQAFVFDSVYKLSDGLKTIKILCVGSYEDTASMSLKKMGFNVEEIDPVINYSVQEFSSKPSSFKKSYDIIFSTSVIEHVLNDESFVSCISNLLNPGGYAIFTCDFKEGWKSNESIPECNFRFYSVNDFMNRLLPSLSGCNLIDEPNWNCPNPDFYFDNKKYNYTFATFVVRKSL
jgi:hypothetical protein